MNRFERGMGMKKIFALALVLVVLVSVAVAEEYPEFYPRLAVVVEIYPEDDLVVCLDKYGEEWLFFGADTWAVGDLCNLLMFNNGEDYTEHEIVEIYWEGYLEPEEMEIFINHWFEAE